MSISNTRLFFLLLICLLTACGCAVNPVTGQSELAFMQLTPAQEVRLGRSAYEQALQKYGGRYQDEALNAYINRVGQRLVRTSHRPELGYQFSVINDSTPNAFALPGGYVAITRGLLVQLGNEAELAAVLGHEIAHVTARHSLQGMQRSTLLGAALGVVAGVADSAGYGSLVSPLGEIATSLIDKRFSREQESESDRLGIDYMVRAGYDPIGAVQLQELFSREIETGSDTDWLSGLFRSHPFSKQRLEENRNYIASTYPDVNGDGLDAVDFARSIEVLIQTREGYATYDEARLSEKQGDLTAAITLYHQALLEAPDEPPILGALGLAYLRHEDLVPARRYLIKAINYQADYYQTRLGLGYIYLQKKEYPKAQEQLEKGFSLLPTLEGGYMLAEARENNLDFAGARELYAAVAKADPQGKLGQSALARLRQLQP